MIATMKTTMGWVVAVALVPATIACVGSAQARRTKTVLTPLEQRIVADVDRTALAEALPLLERTVRINSGSLNGPGVRKVSEIYRTELERIGLSTWWVPLKKVKRGPHLFARRRGRGGHQAVLLIGHSDTVFAPSSPFQRFERLDQHRVKGPGVFDMKGGNLVIIQALKSLHRVGALAGANVIVAMMADEEKVGRDADGSMRTSRDPLSRLAQESDVGLGFEPGIRDTVTVARRGIAGWRLRATAHAAHSSIVFKRHTGPGAIYPVALVLGEFYRALRGWRYLTFNAALVAGGDQLERTSTSFTVAGKLNIVPSRAEAAGDLRFIDRRQRARAKRRMQQLTAKVARRMARAYRSQDGKPLVALSLRFRDGYPPMPPTAANHALLRQLSAISVAVGAGPLRALDPSQRGAADLSVVASHVRAALGGLGPVGSGAHTDRETVDLRSLVAATKRTAVLVHRLCQAKLGAAKLGAAKRGAGKR